VLLPPLLVEVVEWYSSSEESEHGFMHPKVPRANRPTSLSDEVGTLPDREIRVRQQRATSALALASWLGLLVC
jgi:hypothetical protein